MSKSTNSIFGLAFKVIERIENAGGEAYVVGGAVRDYLSNREVKDIDIATSEPPERIQQLFEKVVPVGIEHGTVIVLYESESFEVTTYRTEKGYQDFRHPDKVTFVKDIREDLSRRDFTINAMAIDQQGNIIDPYNGQQAIRDNKIIAVGHANTRFQEDPLRMMRAIRFASQLEFLVEKETEEAIMSTAPQLSHIAVERLAIEFEKLFAGPGYRNGLELLSRTGLTGYLPKTLPENLLNQVPNKQLSSFGEIISFYVDQYPKYSVKDWVKGWKLSNKVKQEALDLTEALQEFCRAGRVTAWILYLLPTYLYSSFARVLGAEGLDRRGIEATMKKIHDRLPIRSRQELAFQAKDLISLYSHLPKGPWISEAMNRIEYAVVESHLPNEYEKIKEWVSQWNPPAGS